MRIGEVAKRSGVSARMLRHYDTLGLVRPTGRSGSGYREYSGDDIRRIFHVESLRSLGLSLSEVKRALDDPGFVPATLVHDLIRRTRQRIADETELLDRLRRIGAATPTGWEEVLQTVALLQALGSESAGKRQRAALLADAPAGGPTGGATGGLARVLAEAALGEDDPHVAGALRWSLAQTGNDGLSRLAAGLADPSAEVRHRAVRTITEIPTAKATALLRQALGNPDEVVRRYAALTLGARGVADAVPTLADMIVAGTNDVEAADALSTLASTGTGTGTGTGGGRGRGDGGGGRADDVGGGRADDVGGGDPAAADQIAAALIDRIVPGADAAPARRRLAQALAGIPGTAATRVLTEMSDDDDRGVALTAAYVLTLRDQVR